MSGAQLGNGKAPMNHALALTIFGGSITNDPKNGLAGTMAHIAILLVKPLLGNSIIWPVNHEVLVQTSKVTVGVLVSFLQRRLEENGFFFEPSFSVTFYAPFHQ